MVVPGPNPGQSFLPSST
jgi:S-phase kinase-associated protein 1